jgi:hypothetical protein
MKYREVKITVFGMVLLADVIKVNVKQSRYSPGVAQKVPES